MARVIAIICFLGFVNSFAQNPKVRVNYAVNNTQNQIPKEDLEHFWHQFIFLQEGNWVYYFIKVDKSLPQSTKQQEIKKYCVQLCSYFLQKGVDAKHAFIHFQDAPFVAVFKEKGKDKPANFIHLPKSYLQVFYINNAQGGICDTKAGNKIVFKPNVFKVLPNTEVKIEVYEMLHKKDMIVTGYTAESNDKILESNGMYKINASANGFPVEFKQNAGAEILYHQDNFNHVQEAGSYLTYYADDNKDNLNWKPDYSQKVENKNNQEYADLAANKNQTQKKSISRYTEIHYMQLHRKINYIEPTMTGDCKECVLSAANFTFLVDKYGELQYNKKNTGMNLKPISTYNDYVLIFKKSPMDIFIGLNPEQEKLMKENQDIENQKIAKELEAQRLREEEERKRLEEEKRLAMAEELKKFPAALKISELGNINCDRFYNVEKKTDVIVNLNEYDFDEIRVYVVFNKIKSVIPGYYREGDKGTIKFTGLPVGEDVVYLAATFKGDAVKLAYVNKSIRNKDIVPLEFKTLSMQQYENIMNDLIPN